jgi:hypothetical protein
VPDDPDAEEHGTDPAGEVGGADGTPGADGRAGTGRVPSFERAVRIELGSFPVWAPKPSFKEVVGVPSSPAGEFGRPRSETITPCPSCTTGAEIVLSGRGPDHDLVADCDEMGWVGAEMGASR